MALTVDMVDNHVHAFGNSAPRVIVMQTLRWGQSMGPGWRAILLFRLGTSRDAAKLRRVASSAGTLPESKLPLSTLAAKLTDTDSPFLAAQINSRM